MKNVGLICLLSVAGCVFSACSDAGRADPPATQVTFTLKDNGMIRVGTQFGIEVSLPQGSDYEQVRLPIAQSSVYGEGDLSETPVGCLFQYGAAGTAKVWLVPASSVGSWTLMARNTYKGRIRVNVEGIYSETVKHERFNLENGITSRMIDVRMPEGKMIGPPESKNGEK